MQTSTLITSIISAWSMAIVYYEIEVKTGVEFKLLLVAAIITMTIGLYLSCRNSKEITKEEA